MWSRLATESNPWVEAERIERIKNAAAFYVYAAAVCFGLGLMVYGLMRG